MTALERGRVDAAMLYSNGLSSYLRRNPSAVLLADMRTPEGFRKVTGAADHAGVAVAVMQWITGHRPEESLERLPVECRSQDAAADLDAIRDATADLNPAGIITLEMAKVTQRMLAVSIPEVASLDAARTFTNEFVPGQ